MEENQLENQISIKRSQFLEIAIWSIGGIIAMGIGIPAISYVVGTSLQNRNKQEWISLGSISKVEIGVPTLFKAKVKRQVGWNTTEEELSIYIVTENGRDFIALSNICTHLGCRVRWIKDKEQFICPCHNGVFDKNGNAVSGPPPKSLNQYQVKVENDQLYVMEG